MEVLDGSSNIDKERVSFGMKRIYLISLMWTVILISGGACEVSQPSPSPPRNFTTAALVINPSLLPPEWKVIEGPGSEQPHVLGLRKNQGGSYIILKDSESNIDHIVAIFANSQDAALAFKDHDFTRDTQGKFARTWKPPSGFAYDSPIADLFRVVCVEINNKAEIGDIGEICAVEAQYDEFVSILIYRTTDQARVNPDLEVLAKAVDTQMGKFLVK
jgi:hypothetical protein